MSRKNWEFTKVANLCNRIGDGLHGTPDYVDEGEIYFVNGVNIKDGRITVFGDTKKVNIGTYEKNYIPLSEKTLLMSINGTLGNMAFYKDEQIMLGKSAAYLNFKTNINRFYYYYFQLPGVQEYFYNVATGSTIKNLGLKAIQDFQVPFPMEDEWKPIAKVLSDLDAKIELNNKINAELEAMAKLIYDYWFVQFEFPNEDGKPYKSSGGKMVWNEELKREVPEGWEVKNLFESCKVQYGFPFSTDYFNTEGHGKPVIRIRDILDNSISNYSTQKDIDSKYLIKKGDVLIGMDGNFHINYWSKEDSYLNQRVVKLTETFLPSIYLRYQIEPYIQLREKSVSRTTVGHLSDKDLKAISVLIPEKETLKKMRDLYQNTLNEILSNQNQSQKLAELRDWLLPMLMNGQVWVDKLSDQEEHLNMAAEEREKYR